MSDESAVVTADAVDIVDAVVIDEQSLVPQGTPCEACGSPVEPGDKFCPACGSPRPTPSRPVEAELIEDDQKHFRCNTCGAEVATDPDQRSYVCAFCDSTYVVEFSRNQTDRQRPEFAIGFAVTPEQALAKFRQWLSSNHWFRPGDLPQAQIEEKLRGVYLPFWSFSMLAQSNWSARIGEYWYQTETYRTRDANGKMVTRTRRVRKTEWWPLSGRHHRYYGGYLVSGSKGLPQQQAERIKPFQLPALKRYEPYFLAGWLSEEYSVERADALRICQQEFYRREQANTAAFLPGDTYSNLDVRTTFSHINSDLCLLPVYLLSYRYKEKLYRFMVNGQTGKTAGDKPLSWRRIGVVIAVAVALIAIIVLIFLLFGGGLAALEG